VQTAHEAGPAASRRGLVWWNGGGGGVEPEWASAGYTLAIQHPKKPDPKPGSWAGFAMRANGLVLCVSRSAAAFFGDYYFFVKKKVVSAVQ
jgi:hypothetical protein